MNSLSPYLKRLVPLVVLAGGVTSLPAGDTNPVLWTYRKRAERIVDVLPYQPRTVILLFERKGPVLFDVTTKQQTPLDFPSKQNAVCLRIFRGGSPEVEFVVVARVEKSIWFYGRKEGIWQRMAETGESFDYPRYYQDKSGAIWIWGTDGVIVRFADGQTATREYTPRSNKSSGSSTRFQSLALAESDDGTICFYPINADEAHGMHQLLLYRKGTWIEADYPKQIIGGAGFGADGKLWIASDKGITPIEIGKDAGTIAPTPTPSNDTNRFEYPLLFTSFKSNLWVSLWSQRTGATNAPPDVSPDGYIDHVAELSDRKWKVIPMGGDRAGWTYFGETRCRASDVKGGLWLTTSKGGVLHRAPDGKWTRLDWRRGMPFNSPVQIVVDAEDVLWVVDRSGGCVALDTRVAESLPENPKSNWSAEFFRSKLVRAKNDSMYAVSSEHIGRIAILGPKGKDFLAMDPALAQPQHHFELTFDSEGGLWLLGTAPKQASGYYNGTKWKVYNADTNNFLHEREIAFQEQARRGENYRIGRPEENLFVLFSKDGRIVYRNESHRVCYFDGTK